MKQGLDNVWSDEAIANFWNQMSQTDVVYFSEEVGDLVLQKLRINRDKTFDICDLGGGSGNLFPHAKKIFSNSKYSLFDVSDDSLTLAQSKYGTDPQFKSVNHISKIFDDRNKDQYDLVVSLEVIEHLSDDKLDEFGKQLSALCKLGGEVLISTPNDEKLEEKMLFCPGTNKYFHRMQHVRSWSEETLSQFLEQYGFEKQYAYQTALIRSPMTKLKFNIKNILKGKKFSPNLIIIAKKTR